MEGVASSKCKPASPCRLGAVRAGRDLHVAVQPGSTADGPMQLPKLPATTPWLLIAVQVCFSPTGLCYGAAKSHLRLLRPYMCLLKLREAWPVLHRTSACSSGVSKHHKVCKLPAPCSRAWLTGGHAIYLPGSLAQAVALLGCLVTGTLARQRRMKVDALNSRLRQINTELRRRTSVEACQAQTLRSHPLRCFEPPPCPQYQGAVLCIWQCDGPCAPAGVGVRGGLGGGSSAGVPKRAGERAGAASGCAPSRGLWREQPQPRTGAPAG